MRENLLFRGQLVPYFIDNSSYLWEAQDKYKTIYNKIKLNFKKMENLNLIETFSEFKEFKNIDRETMMSVLEEVFRSLLLKKYKSEENFNIIINIDKGDFEIWRNREVVEDNNVTDPNTQISLSEAKIIDTDYEVGEDVADEVKLADFGRREILTLRQSLSSRILEFEKNNVFNKYKDRIGEMITGEVYQVWKREILIIDDEGNELILTKTEQIPSDYFRKGDTVRAVVIKVDIKNNTPLIVLSRTSPVLLQRLFELEVPEIFDGLITIKKIVRIPGERAKVSVESYDERIDPVGACVGMKGSRIHGIVRELKNENIDVISYTTNIELYIMRALNPAKVNSIKINKTELRADVYLNPDQVSLAIGKGGSNIKLAGEITGYEIDVYRDIEEDEEDIDIEEFVDEIEDWIINELKAIGCDTAKSVLDLSIEDLVKRTDLEEETIKEVIKVFKAEFD